MVDFSNPLAPAGTSNREERATTYFVANASGQIKIGRTTRDMRVRLADLQTASAEPLTLELTLEGDREREMHALFSRYRVSGEWFLYTAEIRNFISAARVNVPAPPSTDVPHTILELMDLFGPRFQGPSWVPWRVLLAATFGLPITDQAIYPGPPETTAPNVVLRAGMTDREIFEACTGRTQLSTDQVQELWMIVGRRGGKSQIAAIIAIFLACCRVYDLSPGEMGMVMILAPKKDQTRVIYRYARALMKMTPCLDALVAEYRKTDIELKSGIIIEPQTASAATSRGYTVVGLICDEIAFWRSRDDAANPDAEVLNSLRPAMSTIENAILVSLSSPYARRGELFTNFREHYGKDGDPILVWKADTLSMHPNPKVARYVERRYEEDEASARAEFGAEFRSDLEQLFGRDAVEGVVDQDLIESLYEKGISYRAFVDPSGGSSDSMVLAIGHTDKETGVEVCDMVREIKAPFSPKTVVEEFVGLIKSYKLAAVTGDRYAGEWPREAFRDAGVEYKLADKTRSDLYLATLPLVNSKTCKLPNNKRMINQMISLERRTGRGKDSVDHPPGGHDDVANAVAGVLVGCDTTTGVRVRGFKK